MLVIIRRAYEEFDGKSGVCLKRATLTLLLLAFSLLLFLTLTTFPVHATTAGIDIVSLNNFQIKHVNHEVQIWNGGMVTINDTISLSPKPDENSTLLSSFSMGFPFRYKPNLDYCFAYNTSNPNQRFEITLDTGLGRIGFYGINVVFPEGTSIGPGSSYSFTVFFVFSNLISSEAETGENVTNVYFDLDFPTYPSFLQNASSCDVTVTLPENSSLVGSSFDFKGFIYNLFERGPHTVLNHTRSPLAEFSLESDMIEFTSEGTISLINANEMSREITLNEWGQISFSDFYYITSKGDKDVLSVAFRLPAGASGVSARDELGSLSPPTLENETTYLYRLILRTALKKSDTIKFTITYQLPWEKYVNQYDWSDFSLKPVFFEHYNWTIRKLSVKVSLPEGAEFQSSSVSPDSLQKSVLQETLTFAFYNVTPFQSLALDISYRYLMFWASFRPMLWIGALVVVGCVVAFAWRGIAPKAPAIPVIPVPPKDLERFVDAYEEKTTVLRELELIEEQLRKGKIPRRRYKVRRKTLEGRLSVLSRDLADLREKIRAASSRYATIMSQVEMAETMLEGAETDIRRVEARYRSGALSKGAYQRLLEEYYRRREKAKVTIDGVLLRLREEIR